MTAADIERLRRRTDEQGATIRAVSDTVIDIKVTVDQHTGQLTAIQRTLAQHGEQFAGVERTLVEQGDRFAGVERTLDGQSTELGALRASQTTMQGMLTEVLRLLGAR